MEEGNSRSTGEGVQLLIPDGFRHDVKNINMGVNKWCTIGSYDKNPYICLSVSLPSQRFSISRRGPIYYSGG